MLVKFLSFVASVLGTQRYKTILLSSFAVVLSLTGVTALAVFRESAPEDQAAASAVDKTDDSDTKTESKSPQLSNNSKQTAKDTNTGQDTTDQSQSSSSQDTGNTDTSADNDTTSKADTKVTVNTDNLTITAGTDANNPTITASTSDKTAVVWSITIDDQDAQSLRVVNSSKTNSAVLTFQLQADKDVPKGKQFKVTLLARDTERGINIPTTITVTVQ